MDRGSVAGSLQYTFHRYATTSALREGANLAFEPHNTRDELQLAECVEHVRPAASHDS
jgi:hypothetical protein